MSSPFRREQLLPGLDVVQLVVAHFAVQCAQKVSPRLAMRRMAVDKNAIHVEDHSVEMQGVQPLDENIQSCLYMPGQVDWASG